MDIITLPFTAMIILCASCKREGLVESKPDGIVLAMVGNQVITVEDFQNELGLHPTGGRGNLAASEARKRLLEGLIRRKAAVIKAREAGVDKDPATLAMIERLIAERYRNSEFGMPDTEEPSVSDAEIGEYYESNEARFRIPEAVRAGSIWIKVDTRVTEEKRAAVRARAESVLSEARRADDRQFRMLVVGNSEDQSTRYTGGDTGWLEETESVASGRRATIAATARTLAAPGDVSPLVECEDGFLIVRLTDRKVAGHRPLAEVADAIRYELLQRKRLERETAFFEGLEEGLKIEINDPLLESLKLPDSPELAGCPPALPEN